MRKAIVLLFVLVMAATALPAGAGTPFPDEIDLPEGYFPEGIATGRGTSFYVGSLADGSVYKGDLRTGEGDVLVAPFGAFTTVGIEVDRQERIWVAGGPSGTGRVYDGKTGELLALYEFTGPGDSFVNDVVVTKHAAYFTDSGTQNEPPPGALSFPGEPRLFVVPLGNGQSLPDPSAVHTLATDLPDLAFPNLNGIETLPNGKGLVIAHTAGGVLFALDPATGEGTQIDLGVGLLGADGLIRRGTTVYVVENGAAQVTAVKIRSDGSSGWVAEVYPVDGAETPTTAALFGNALYVVDARFASGVGPYKVFRVDL
jgi:sugar lactone lactonase YvrE